MAVALPPTYSTGGSGWDEGTLAFGTSWTSARDPKLRGPQLRALSSQLSLGKSRQALNSPIAPSGGSGLNAAGQQGRAGFSFQIPITALPGRGMDLALNLYYNSQVWLGTKEAGFSFDLAADWPAPGFQLGFGRIGRTGDTYEDGNYLVDADGTIHRAVFVGRRDFGDTSEISLRTVDSSFIEYRVEFEEATQRLRSAVARLPDGTEIEFRGMSAKDPLVLYPTRIRDAQGNIILIIYRTDRAPEIDNIVDTVGRGLRFHYNSNQLLTAITGEGYAGGPSRVIARLHYSRIDLKLRDAFAGRVITRDCTPQGGEPVVEPCPWMLDAVFYPGTKTGFWMGSYRNNDSAYSSYGMLARESEQRGMSMSFGSSDPDMALHEQGSVSPGPATRERYYNYPMTPAIWLTSRPIHKCMNAGSPFRPTLLTSRTNIRPKYTTMRQTRPRERQQSISPRATPISPRATPPTMPPAGNRQFQLSQ